MVLEFQGADRVRDAFDGVGLAVRVIVTRIDRPGVAGARMGGVQNAIQHGVAQIDIARGHIDFGAQHPGTVGKFASFHAAKQIEIFFYSAVAKRAVLAGLGQRASLVPDFLLRLVVDIGKAGADQVFRPAVKPLEIIRGIEQVLAPVVTEPVHVGLNRIDVFLLFPGRVGIVEPQVAASRKLLRDAEIERDRLGMADMQIAVRLRREPGHDHLVLFAVEIGLDDVANEIAPRLRRHRFCRHSEPVPASGISGRSAKSTAPKEGFSYATILLYTSAPGATPYCPRTADVMPDSVVTRFAPSPTGFLHIGGARTALFNWLYAQKLGGKMLLRIEDTDRERSTEPAIAAILDGLKWLGLDWDGEVIYQFSRAARHREVAETLLASGKAYRCYATQEQLTAMREKARAEGRTRLYDGMWRDRDASEAPDGMKPTIRLRAPQTGETVIEDQVQGRVVWQNENLDDLVLLRGDGNPTYMLAVVVDDHDMGVTHVIRGDDHLINAARQKQIYDALGWDLPNMSHIPLIHGPDGAKLSKRHGALGVDAYRAMGYVPAALRNYLVRLGWSHGDQEIFSTEEMIALFDLPAIGRSAARFDFAKLENLNGHYIRHSDDQSLVTMFEGVLDYVPGGADLKAKLNDTTRAQLLRAMPSLKERAKTLIELLDGAYFIFADRPLEIEPKALALLTPENRELIGRLRLALEAVTPWTAEATEAAMRAFAEANSLKLGAVAQPLRAALTGRTTSPGIFDVLAVLGRQECLARLGDQTPS